MPSAGEQRQGMEQPTQEPDSFTGPSTSASEELESQPLRPNEPYRDVGMESPPAMTKQEIHAGQKEDPVLCPVLHYKSLNQEEEEVSDQGWHPVPPHPRLPKGSSGAVKTALYNNSGHLGFERTVHMIRERFHWPQMFQEIKAWCEQCDRCCLRKTLTAGVRAPLVSIHSSAPMELVCVDFLTQEKSKGGIENVLIVTDQDKGVMEGRKMEQSGAPTHLLDPAFQGEMHQEINTPQRDCLMSHESCIRGGPAEDRKGMEVVIICD